MDSSRKYYTPILNGFNLPRNEVRKLVGNYSLSTGVKGGEKLYQ